MAKLLLPVAILAVLALSDSSSAKSLNLEQARFLTFKVTKALKKSSSYKTFGRLLESTGLVFSIAKYVRRGTRFTLLAPTDAAFTAAGISADTLPCGSANSNNRVVRNFVKTAVALHLLTGRYSAVDFDRTNVGGQFFTGTAVPLRKINNTLDAGQFLGVLSALTNEFISITQITKGNVVRRSSNFAVHGINAVLSYPYQFEG